VKGHTASRRRAIFLTVVGHIIAPISLVVQLRDPEHALAAWLVAVFFAAGYFAFIYLVGAWSWFGRLYRRSLMVLLVAAAWATYPTRRGHSTTTAPIGADSVLPAILGACFTTMAVLALRGRKAPGSTLNLSFPLRGGTFHVGQGGASRLVNYHFPHPSQRYALDILCLNRLGIRARGFYPRQVERYAIWGAEIVSPCDGVVMVATDGFPDLSPPESDPQHPAGNCVAIETAGGTVYLAHLMRNSITVRVGDRVRRGQLLGRVGNSGNTTEPHLHVHAEQGAYSGTFSGRPGVPVRFEGRFLVRNDQVKVPAA
jgi:Peptidase family M23